MYEISLKIRQVKMFSEFHLGKWSNLTSHKQIYRFFFFAMLFFVQFCILKIRWFSPGTFNSTIYIKTYSIN